MQTTANLVTVVRKSSAECAKWNAEQAEMIAAGIVLPQQPNADILKAEAEYAKQQERDRKRQEAKKNFLTTLAGINPHNVQLGLKEMWEGNSRWSSGKLTGYKLVIGSGYSRSANKTWMKVGTETNPFELTPAQALKAAEKIAQIAKGVLAARAAQNAAKTSEELYKALVAKPEGKALVARLTGSTYVPESYSPSELSMLAADVIKYRYETFNIEQWGLILDLRDAQKASMQALKDSFKK